MAQRLLKATLTRGELTPLAQARVDTELYQQAAEIVENFFVLKEGGVRRRSGTRYRGVAKSSTTDIRLLDFRFSATQAYAVELGNLYARFWTSDGQVASGLSPYEIVSPYPESALRSLQWVQSGDVIYVAHRSMTIKPQKLVRTSDTNWAFSTIDFIDGPYLPINDASNTCTPSAAPVTGATSVLTFANVKGINKDAGLQTTDVGRAIRVQFNGKWSWGKITVRSSTTVCTVLWTDGQGGTTASLSWRLGAFSDTTGYPGAVAIFQGRVFWGGTPVDPRYIGYSYSGLPERFFPSEVDGTVTDSSGGAVDLLAGDEILWVQEAARLQVGTPSGVRSVGAQDTDQYFSPRNVSQKLEMPDGVSSVRPCVVGSSTVHCSRFEKSIHDLYYDFQANALVNPELSVTAEHLTYSGVKEMTFQQQPHRRLFAIVDGDLISTTINRFEKVSGFSKHTVDGDVITMASVPGTNQHDLWLVVRRTINGTQKQYVETLDPDFLRGSVDDAFFSDCGGTYEGVETNTVTGATWLAGKTVTILADGKVLPPTAVSVAGVLTLPNAVKASVVQFGLPIQAKVKLLRAPAQAADGTAFGRRMRIVGADTDVYETKGLKIVSNRGKTDLLKEAPASTREAPGALITGTRRVMVDGSWTSEGQLEFLMDDPLPGTIRAVNVYVETED